MNCRSDRMINPETKVGELLEWYPELESTLISIAPAFAKLRNPVLRKTVARVTNLRQAALVGKIPVGELINRLRREVGQGQLETEAGEDSSHQEEPRWASLAEISREINITPILESGEKPLGIILSALQQLEPGKVLRIRAPFLPAPLIDNARAKDFQVWWEEKDGETVLFIRKPDAPAELVDLS